MKKYQYLKDILEELKKLKNIKIDEFFLRISYNKIIRQNEFDMNCLTSQKIDFYYKADPYYLCKIFANFSHLSNNPIFFIRNNYIMYNLRYIYFS